jgi:hypothetical protein
MGYRAALRWLLANDDTTFLDDEEPIPSVTASFAADMFGKSDAEVVRDLFREREKLAKERP